MSALKMNRNIWWSTVLVLVFCPRLIRGQEPAWEVNAAAYSNSMNIVGFLWLDNVESTDEGDLVAAFIDGELRGVASPEYIATLDRYALFLSVFSNDASGSISFQVYDASKDAILDLVNTATFTPDALIGGFDASFLWSNVSLNAEASINSFTLPVQYGETIFDDDTIRIMASLEIGEDLNGLIASFSASPNALITVNEVDQVSGTTLNDFTSVVSYRVQSEDLLTVNRFHVKVTLVNRAPASLSLDNLLTPENQNAVTFVGNLSTVDEDENDSHTYTLVSGNGDEDNALFSLQENALITATSLDFEASATRNIRVRSTDTFGKSVEKAITIIVSNLNDAPENLSLSALALDENLPAGTELGLLSATDQDAGETFSFSLVSGAADDDNGLFSISGNRVLTNQPFNHEEKELLKVRLRVTDNAGASIEETFQIQINDQNDAPVYKGGLDNLNIAAGEVFELEIVPGTFTDEDEGELLTYSATTSDGNALPLWMVFNDLTNRILMVPGTNHVGRYEVKVSVTDQQEAMAEATFTVEVSIVSSIEDLPQISELVSVFPNPTLDKVKVNTGPLNSSSLELEMVDQSGRRIAVKAYESLPNEWVLDLAGLPTGLFVLRLSDGEKLALKKVIKR